MNAFLLHLNNIFFLQHIEHNKTKHFISQSTTLIKINYRIVVDIHLRSYNILLLLRIHYCVVDDCIIVFNRLTLHIINPTNIILLFYIIIIFGMLLRSNNTIW